MSWPVIQMYDMSDADAQELVVGLLKEWDGVVARPAFSGPDVYVIVECGDSARAHAIFRTITSVDPGATLVHTTDGHLPEFSRPLELEVE